jgi:hypothetical protein
MTFKIARDQINEPGIRCANHRREASTTTPTRPAILPNRWEEDWSVLADPRVPERASR